MRNFQKPGFIIALITSSVATLDGAPSSVDVSFGASDDFLLKPRQGHQNLRKSSQQRALKHLTDFADDMLTTQHSNQCTIIGMGTLWGEHALCADLKPREPSTCVFYSYGISSDYSFDTMLADEWGCKGVALDPSVTHPSKLHPKVTFHNIAARTLDAKNDAQWDIVATVPGLKKFLGHERINVLKMDCEGCEYALAQDILQEHPKFLHSVDQLAMEIHVSQMWLKSDAHAHHLGMLYALAKEAGLRLAKTVFTGCAPEHEAFGCHPVLEKAGFPCEAGRMCINVLFARI